MRLNKAGRSQRDCYRRLNWARFTDFESRYSRNDLEALCKKRSQSELVEVFKTRDEAGLYPIHWAAINNRSDLINFMVDNGSPLRVKCKNKLFADGSPLHLAAINGSIEAASMLLRKFKLGQTEPKQFETLTVENPNDSRKPKTVEDKSDWLLERDAEGQTPLLRCAPPRSKRMNTVRGLLQKNLWSLSGRPAETALFLICNGADWRQTDSINNMNLMHWAIVNDHDDIVHLLLVIDKDLMKVPARLIDNRTERRPPDVSPADSGLESIPLGSSSVSRASSTGSSSRSSDKSLINTKEKMESITSGGLLPIQIATIYGRVSIISLLWHAQAVETSSSPKAIQDSLEYQKKLLSKRSEGRKELKRILSRAFWSNKEELARFFRRTFLKFILALDLALMVVRWIPIYATTHFESSFVYSLRSGVFIFAYCASMALAFRVMLKNPGYLRRSSLQYLNEMKDLLGKIRPAPLDKDTNLSIKPEATGQNEIGRKLPETKSQSMEDKKNVVVIESRWQQKPNLEDRVRILCHKCRCIRRPRSRHCNYCNHCIQDFDHHCVYLGCCVGRYNRLDFLLTMVVLTLTGLYGTLIFASHMTMIHRYDVWSVLDFIWIFKYVFIGGLSSFFILRRAALGVTMYEAIRSKRIRKIFGPGGAPEEISKSHKIYSTLRGSFWRYTPDRFLTGDLPAKSIVYNLKEFSNFVSLDEYLLTVVCPDTPLGRSLTSNDSRLNLYKFV